MTIQIRAIGGFAEVGKNMAAVKIDDDVIILDMGLHLPNYIKYTEEALGEIVKLKTEDLIKVGAIADDNMLKDWKNKVKAIVISHAHLDHVGAVPYLAPHYPNAPIISTEFTTEFLKITLKNEKISLTNKLIGVLPNARIKTGKIEIEFVNVTHSIPQTAIVAIHTHHGTILFGPDYKLDDNPLIGKIPNYKRLESLGEEGVTALICDSLNADKEGKTPSEAHAKELLESIIMDTPSKNKAIIVTTFSSHIARLKTISEIGRKMNRKVVFLGRSIAKYTQAAQDTKITNFSQAEIIYGKKVQRKLKEMQKKGMQNYLIVCTGHQGEPKSVLNRIATGQYGQVLKAGDHLIFSSNIIPAKINQEQRARLEELLAKQGIHMFTGVHVSGHCSREDMKQFIQMTKPEKIIPIHSEPQITERFIQLCEDMGYKKGKNAIIMKNGETIEV